MRDEEKKMMILLSEIKEACESCKARYYVIEQELLCSVRGKRAYEAEADICMLYGDYLKIQSILKDTENRCIESILENIRMPGMYFRYVDKESLYYVQKYHRVRTAHGVAVNIHILRNTADSSKKLTGKETAMEAALEENGKAMAKIWFPGLFTKKMEKLLSEAALTDISEKSMLKIPGQKAISFPAGFWKKQSVIRFGGVDLTTVSDAEKYLVQRYGENYLEDKIINLRANYQVISDPDVEYSLVAGKMNAFFDKVPGYWAARDSFTSFYNNTYEDMAKTYEERIIIMSYIGDRFKMWKKYMPVKDDILKMLREGKTDETFLIVSDYFDLFRKYLKKDMVLYFDEDYWQICSKLWSDCGYGELIEKAEMVLEINKPIELPVDMLNEVFKDNRPVETATIRKY